MTPVSAVRALAQQVCEPAGLELVDVELNGGILRVTIDHPDGLPVGSLTDVTRKLNRLLDDDDPIPGRYTLEVSSPGLERKLRTPAHFRRSVGETVSVRSSDRDPEGPRRVTGVLAATDDETITIEAEDGTTVELRHDQIDKARTVFEWDAHPKGGRASNKRRPGRKKEAKR